MENRWTIQGVITTILEQKEVNFSIQKYARIFLIFAENVWKLVSQKFHVFFSLPIDPS